MGLLPPLPTAWVASSEVDKVPRTLLAALIVVYVFTPAPII